MKTRVPAVAGLGVLALLPLAIGAFGEFVLMIAFIYVIVAAGLHVLVHWAGQISFGHIAFVALGANVTARLAGNGWPYLAAVLGGVAAALFAGLLVGLPALRIRGFYLAIVTFAFGFAADRWLFHQSWLTGAFLGGNSISRPRVLGQDVYDAGLYLVVLASLVVVLAALLRLRRSKPGRAMVAVRDSEELAASFGVNVSAFKVLAFLVSSGVAGFGGALWVTALGVADKSTFPVALSVLFVSLVVIGGAGSLWGTVVVALSFGLLPPLIGGKVAEWFGLAGPVLLLLVIVQYPGGQNEATREMARQARALWARLRPQAAPSIDLTAAEETVSAPPARRRRRPRARPVDLQGPAALRIENLSVRFGGVQALSHVSLTAAEGRTTGLIGPNGAGKSTTINCISGFVRPDEGRLEVLGHGVIDQPPHRRAALGLGRTFQQLAVCPEETARENLLIAQHRLAARGRRLDEAADEALERLGIGHVADRAVRDLPLGTAKLVELACVLVGQPKLLLLDEPTGGLSQQETERLQAVLAELQRDRGLSVLLVSHDMRFMMGSADYVYVLNFGEILTHGTPREIRDHAGVVEAYLGTKAAVPS